MKSKSCKCNLSNKITCRNCSVLKMVILLKNGNNHLKFRQSGGRLVNPVWYNHISKNNKSVSILVNAMTRRFFNSKYHNLANKLIFYNNVTKQEIATVQL